jgi:uncharacterized membrane protein YeaQ/YmgE (transglycosylase-associated protein family)
VPAQAGLVLWVLLTHNTQQTPRITHSLSKSKIFIDDFCGGDMSLLGLLILIVIAAVTGAIGQTLAGYSLGGCLGSILVGFIGAFLGMWIANTLGLPEIFTIMVEGQAFPVVWSIIGSAILSFVFGLIGSRRRYYA